MYRLIGNDILVLFELISYVKKYSFLLKDGSAEDLVTNLTPEQIASEKFSELYRLHWGAESNYRELKNRFEIESFNSIKLVSVRQEFFAAMYLSNLAEIIKQAADSLVTASVNNNILSVQPQLYIKQDKV